MRPSLNSQRLLHMISVGAVCAMLGAPAIAQNLVFSTHDWSIVPGVEIVREAWADVKMPGGFPVTAVPGAVPSPFDTRFTFVVGTIEVSDTTDAALFSTATAGTAGIPTFSLLPPATRQVVMLQVNDAVVNFNGIQVFFYGETPGVFTRATNGRGISVWRGPLNILPGGLDSDDRIAICGETYDQALRLSQSPAPSGGWLTATATNPSGFIAVYDGTGTLLWTHHFFDPANPGTQDCAITDISIRVDGLGRDVVTYCGISTHGVPAGGELTPILPFPPLPNGGAGGGTPRAAGEWDGFVGRLVRPPGGPTTRLFHSTVGGDEQDGLFGLAEIDADRFVVVGSAQGGDGVGGDDFPLTITSTLAGPWTCGAALLFDASTLATTGLVLTRSTMLGTPSVIISSAFTMARDVHVARNTDVLIDVPPGPAPTPPETVIYVVGSTSDPAFSWDIATAWPVLPVAAQSTLLGPTDGFIAVLRETGTGLTFSYDGGLDADGLTGVSGWSEFSESIAVTGFTSVSGTVDIGVATYFYNNAYGPANPAGNLAPPNGTDQLLRIRTTTLGGPSSEDRPTTMGPISATQTGGPAPNPHPFMTTFSGVALQTPGSGVFVGQEAGGGIAVGNNGRINVVGRSNPPIAPGGYPVFPPGFPAIGSGRPPSFGADAVRTELDLVPPTQPAGPIGFARTDGTGFQAAPPLFPPAPATGFTGGTTPFCSLAEYGPQIGIVAPSLQRILIDIEGAVAAGATTTDAIIVSRPPFQPGGFAVGVLQIGLPVAAPLMLPGPLGAEIWVPSPTTALLFPSAMTIGRSYRLPLPPLPGGAGFTLSAQFLGLLVAPIGGASVPPAVCSSTWVASPCIWFTY